jgi:hypothetical protein
MNLPFVLDVAIGLVFTYLILSLLAAELQELIATVLQWRAKHLKDSIEILLAGGTGTPEEERVKNLVSRLYNDPLLKNVNQEAKGGIAQAARQVSKIFPGNRQGAFGTHQASGPSYIAPETFATTLIEQLGIGSMVSQLSGVRFQRFVDRLIGHYKIENGEVVIPTDDAFEEDWERGNIRTIATKLENPRSLSEDPFFKILVEEYDEILKTFQAKQATLETSLERMGEALNDYMNACAQEPDTETYVRRLRSLKMNVFGEKNDRAILAGGLKPNLSEIAELVNQGSNTYKEIEEVYERIANQARPIDAQVNSSLQAQIEDYRAGLDPNVPNPPETFNDLDYDLQQRFLENALGSLTNEERQLYEDYQTYKQIRGGLAYLPNSVKESLSILARRAQTRVQKAENELNQFQNEIAVWFDRSMSRASGVYKRNAKGVAILIGLVIASMTNSDTVHIFSRISSDDSLRELIKQNATQVTGQVDRARLGTELRQLKDQTDAVLQEVPFPIGWNPVILGNQLKCAPTTPTDQQAANQSPLNDQQRIQREWDQLYTSCIPNSTPTNAPVAVKASMILLNRPLGFLQMIAGWLVSAIAVAMGAPFWFDLLGKLVNVRNTGGKPTSAAGEQQKTN